jgi:hypothetical protein
VRGETTIHMTRLPVYTLRRICTTHRKR